MKKYWEEPVCGIYRISHRDSDKSYIGQSRDVFKRWKEHSNFSKKKLSCISSALKLYSLQSFVWEVIEECSLEELNSREVYWISYFNSMSPNGYNLTSGGNQATTVSEETRARISEATKASMTDERRARISEANKRISEETRAKMSKGAKASMTDKKRARISEATKASMTDERRAKMSEANKGKPRSEETKAKISEVLKASPLITCPYCGKVGRKFTMTRWHFDNCKSKPFSD